MGLVVESGGGGNKALLLTPRGALHGQPSVIQAFSASNGSPQPLHFLGCSGEIKSSSLGAALSISSMIFSAAESLARVRIILSTSRLTASHTRKNTLSREPGSGLRASFTGICPTRQKTTSTTTAVGYSLRSSGMLLVYHTSSLITISPFSTKGASPDTLKRTS